MEFLAIFFLFFLGARFLAAQARQGQEKQLPPGAEPPRSSAQVPEGEQVIRLGPFTIRVPPEARQAQQPPALPVPAALDPWWDEVAEDDAAAADTGAAAYSAEHTELLPYEPPAESVEARPLPAAPLALGGEVDRDAEHARFHTRIDRPRRDAPAPVRARPASARDTLGDLAHPDALRRALLSAEVLGPPRALRDLGD